MPSIKSLNQRFYNPETLVMTKVALAWAVTQTLTLTLTLTLSLAKKHLTLIDTLTNPKPSSYTLSPTLTSREGQRLYALIAALGLEPIPDCVGK